jgi:dihydroflavonol-4-reductase
VPSVLVLGGTGFIGYHATREFRRRGWQVTAVGLPPGPGPGFLPDGARLELLDFAQADDAAVTRLVCGHDAAVFAAGADDRQTPRRPARAYFHTANVEAARRFFGLCRGAGVKHGVLLGSYFSHCARERPELRLAEDHPYIASRVEQEEAAFAAAGTGMSIAVLELPYIFGSAPGQRPLWCPLVRYLGAAPVVFYPRGGSNVVTVEHVAEAIAGAAERGADGRFLIGDENLRWREFLGRLSAAAGRRRLVVTLPDWSLQPALAMVKLGHRLRGREAGLDPTRLLPLQTAELFFDPEPAQKALGFGGGGLDAAFDRTVQACRGAGKEARNDRRSGSILGAG